MACKTVIIKYNIASTGKRSSTYLVVTGSYYLIEYYAFLNDSFVSQIYFASVLYEALSLFLSKEILILSLLFIIKFTGKYQN